MCPIVKDLIDNAIAKAEREKNAALEEKNAAVEEKNAALEEKDAAVRQRNAAVRLLAQALNLSEEEAQARVVQVAATGC